MSYFLNRVCLSMMLAMLFVGCNKENGELNLNESEIFFNEQLSSISVNGEICYIGTEDGIIYRYSPHYNCLDTLSSNLQFDRIYRVIEDNRTNDSIVWVGARNMGLYRCKAIGDSLEVQDSYRIEVNDLKYSPYDIHIAKNSVYVGTSNGFYKVPDNKCSMLQRIYPKDGNKGWRAAQPFVVNCILEYDSRYLVASSDGGVLKVDIQNGNVSVLGSDEKVKSIALKGNEIYALTEKSLKAYDIEGNLKKEFRLEHSAELYYYVPETRITYLINEDHIYLVQDKDLDNPDEYKRVELRRNVRPECRNIIADIPQTNRSFLVTGNALFCIAHNLDIFNNVGEARAAAIDGEYIYYLIGNRVFRNEINGTEDKGLNAKHMLNIPEEYDVKHFTVNDKRIYFIDNSNAIYIIDTELGSNYYMNSLAALFSIKKLGNIEKDVTAFGGGGLLCGIRDSIINIAADRKGERTAMYKNGGKEVNWPFITRFVTHKSDVWASTLNDGIYKGDDNELNIVSGSERFKYIRDIAFTGDDTTPYVLTNHYIYTPDWRDSIKADGFYRLIVTDDRRVYGVGNFGIREFIFSSDGNRFKDYYTDIRFNPEAVVTNGNTIFAGSSCGVFVFDHPLANGAQHNNILFEPAAIERFWEYVIYAIGLILLFVMAVLITVKLEKRRYSIERLNRKKGEILERLYYLESLTPFLSEIIVEKIHNNITRVEKFAVSGGRKSQRTVKTLQKRAEVIREQTEKAGRGLLEEQKKNLKKAGKGYAETLLKESERSMSFAEAAIQIKKNHKWIEKRSEQETIIKEAEEFYASAVVIKGITKGIKAETRKFWELTDENEKEEFLEKLVKRMEEIGSNDNCKAVKDFIDDKITKMKSADIVNEDIINVFGNLKSLVDEVKGDGKKMKELLKDAKVVCCRADMHTCVINIGKQVKEFYENLGKISNCENLLEGIPEYEFSKLKSKREELAGLKENTGLIIKGLNKEIEKFYAPVIDSGIDQELFSLVGLSASNCRNYSNNARIMALLLSGEKVENNHIHLLIGISNRGENMRKERGIVEQNMKKNRDEVLKYYNTHPSSCAGFIISCFKE